jgi:hypothetical protein
MKTVLQLTALTLFILPWTTGCETHERVVVHDRPPPAEVKVVAPPPPVVQERVEVRP